MVSAVSFAPDDNTMRAALVRGLSDADGACVEAAYAFMHEAIAQDAQTPMGQPLREHLFQAAILVNELDLLAEGVIATLLCALPHYYPDWAQQLRARGYSDTIIQLIEGIDEIQKLTAFVQIESLQLPEERARQAETMRKMVLAMVSDIRVVIIKLAMRSRTLEFLAKGQDTPLRRQIAKETMDIFAPLANRLGLWQLKWVLEDLGFRFQHPEEYARIAQLLDEKRSERLAYINNIVHLIETEMARHGIACEVAGRPKHIYSIYKKMSKKKLDFSGLYDIRAVRVLVNSIPECYSALGIVHTLWQPISGEFDDYISHPKANDYRSLHTVVVGPEDKGVEIQIRTFAMHEFAEFGVAAHWRYKEGGRGDAEYEKKIAWLRHLLEWRENLAESDKSDLAAAFQTELFKDTIYVLTPHGKVLSLPAGATPIDFAYALHTSIGDRCRGAKIDGQIAPLSTALETGQRVEIITVKEGHPSVNWLHEGWVKSAKAISKIRAYVRAQNNDALREQGKQLFDRQWSRLPVKPPLNELLRALSQERIEELYAALGRGEISPQAIERAAQEVTAPPANAPAEPAIIRQSRIQTDKNGVLIDGETGLMTVLARCCKPAPPDPVIGFVTRGRGVSVHRKNCPDLLRLAQRHPEKVLEASWANAAPNNVFAIDIDIRAHDRNGLLRDISDVFTRNKLNVTGVNTHSRDGVASMRFTLDIHQLEDLPRVLTHILAIDEVYSAQRI